ncbi:MAG: sel1 repeat family protein [Polaromonas sp.]|nr:sel1 repeat family protein [Polaromonas sp.]
MTLFFDRHSLRRVNWDNQDYRDHCNRRAEQKRRLRAMASIGMALLLLLLIGGWGVVHAQVRAQPAQQFDPAPALAAPLRMQGPDDSAANRDIQRLKSQASALPRTPSANSANGASLPRTSATASAARAAWLLGLIYLHGSGVTRDPVQAALWFERARALGEPLSSAGLAWCEIEGCKGQPDPGGARRWIGLLRSVNPARADFLEWVVESRLSPLQLATPQSGQPVAGASVPARELLLRSAQRGDVNARIELGLLSVAEGRLTEAQEYFKAASGTSAVAAANLSYVSAQLQKGESTSPASLSAEELFLNAQRFHRGEGRPANYAEAIRLYRLAESKGSAQAKRMLALIFSRPTPTGELDVQWMQELSQLNLSKNGPLLITAGAGPQLQREPSPLFDLLPEAWRKRTLILSR